MFIYSLNHLCIAGRFCKRNLNSALPWTQRIPQAVFVHKGGFLFEEWFDVIFVFHEAYYCACTICKYPGLCFLLLKWENCAVICASLTAWFPTTVMFFKRKSRHNWKQYLFFGFPPKSATIYHFTQLSLMIQEYLVNQQPGSSKPPLSVPYFYWV